MDKKSMIYNLGLGIIAIVLLFSFIFIPSTFPAGSGDYNKTYDKLTKTVTIKQILPPEIISNITLINNTDYCVNHCEAEIKLVLEKDADNPFSNISFYKVINGNNISTKIRDYKILVRTDNYTEVKTKYINVCDKLANGTDYCYDKDIGTYEALVWNYENYTDKKFKKGEYYFKITGEKYLEETVEWIPTINGMEITEWAVWETPGVTYGSFTTGPRGMVILMKQDMTLINVTKYNNTAITGPSLIDIYDTNLNGGTVRGNLLNSSIFINSNASFNMILENNKYYWFNLFNNPESGAGYGYNSSIGFNPLPVDGTYLTWTRNTAGVNSYTDGFFMIQQLTFREDINLDPYIINITTFPANVTFFKNRISLNATVTLNDSNAGDRLNISFTWYEGTSVNISNTTGKHSMPNATNIIATDFGNVTIIPYNLTSYSNGKNYHLGVYACDGQLCVQFNSSNITINNTIPFFYNISIFNNVTTAMYGKNWQFNSSTAIGDLDNDLINISFYWIRQPGTLIMTTTNLTANNMTNRNNGTTYYSKLNFTRPNYSLGYNYTLLVRACDSWGCNTSNWSTMNLFINNTLPTLNVSMNYTYSLYTTTDLNCTGNYSDLDGDSGNAFIWVYKNNVFFNQTNFTVTNGANYSHYITNISYKAGDTVICEFFANDTWQKSLYKNFTATIIGNGLNRYNITININDSTRNPQKQGIFSIKSLNPLSYITAVWKWFIDGVGELINYREYFGQVINGTTYYTNGTGNLTSEILNQYAGQGKNLTGVLELTDEDNVSMQFNTSTLMINNTKPFFYNITFWDNITNIYLNSSTKFNCSVAFGDLDNDLTNITFNWYENPNRLLSTTSNNTAWNLTNKNNGTEYYSPINLTSSTYRLGYNYTCRVRACDSWGCNWSNSTNLYINNTIPIISGIYLNFTTGINTTLSNLTVNFTVLEADGNNLKNITNWYLNNKSIMLLNLPFEGGSNDTYTKDYSSNNNYGIVNGSYWNYTGGYDGFGAYQFDGINDYIKIENNPGISFTTQPFSLEVWVYKKGNGNSDALGTYDIIGKSFKDLEPNHGSYALNVLSTNYGGIGNATLFTISDGISWYSATGNQMINNKWYHIVGTWDGIHQSLYMDGVLKSSFDAEITINPTNVPLTIGGLNDSDPVHLNNAWNGTIDDVRIWNRSLSAEQVKFLFENRTDMLSSNELKRRDYWFANITANDGAQDSISRISNPLIILSAPEITQPYLTPQSPQNINDINGSLNYTDLDSDNGNVYFYWYNQTTFLYNINFTGITNGSSVSNILYQGNYTTDNNIILEAYADDGTFNSSIINSTSVLISGTQPYLDYPASNIADVYSSDDLNISSRYYHLSIIAGTKGNLTYLLYINDTFINQTNFTNNINGTYVSQYYNSSLYAKNDIVILEAYSWMGGMNSSFQNLTINILDPNLNAINVSITPSLIYHNQTVYGYFLIVSNNINSIITSISRWFRDGIEWIDKRIYWGQVVNGTNYQTNATGQITEAEQRANFGVNLTFSVQVQDEDTIVNRNTTKNIIDNTIPSFTQNYTLFIDNINLTYPAFGKTILHRILVNDNDGDKMIWCNFTITSQNNTIMVNNINGTRYNAPNDYWWNSSSFLTNQPVRDYGTWNVTWKCHDGFQSSNEGITEFEILENYTFISNLRVNPMDYGFSTNILGQAKIFNSSKINNLNFTLYYPSGGILYSSNSSIIYNGDYWYNSSFTYMLNETGNWKLEVYMLDYAGKSLSQNYTFNVNFTVDYTNKNQSWIGYAPTTSEYSWCYNLSILHNSRETLIFNISTGKWYNSSGMDSTANFTAVINPMTDTIPKSTAKYFSVCYNFTSNILPNEYHSNLTIIHISRGNYTNITYNLTQFLWIDPPTGLPVAYGVVPSTSSICRDSVNLCNISHSMLDYMDYTKEWYIQNDGQFTLRNCVASLKGSSIGSLLYTFEYGDSGSSIFTTPINPTENMKLKLNINPSAPGTYIGELDFNCIASFRGLYNQTLQSSYNKINNESNIPKINLYIASSSPASPSEGGPTGTSGPVITEKPTFVCNTNKSNWTASINGKGFTRIDQLPDEKICRNIDINNYGVPITIDLGCESPVCNNLKFTNNNLYLNKSMSAIAEFCITANNQRYGENNLINITLSDTLNCNGNIEVYQIISRQAILNKLLSWKESPDYIKDILKNYPIVVPIVLLWMIIFLITFYIWIKLTKFSGRIVIGIFFSIIVASGISYLALYYI